MAENDSPNEKMSLRKKIKPPRPFTGDIMDDLSSSIQGDRTIDSPEMNQKSARSPPGMTSDSSSERETTSEKVRPSKSSRKRRSSAGHPRVQKMARRAREDSEPITRGRTLSRPDIWRPGAGMTPANNKRYLGPQTEFNPTLPPARFPTYTSEQYLEDKAAGRNITPEATNSPKPSAHLSEIDAVTEYELSPSESENARGRKGKAHGETTTRTQQVKFGDSTTASKPRSPHHPGHIPSNPTQNRQLNDRQRQPPRPLPPYEPTEQERRRNERVVTAAVYSDSSMRACTSLTGGGGARGLDARELDSQGPLAGDFTFEGWRTLMAQQSQAGEKKAAENEEDDDSSDILDVLDDNVFGDGFVSSQRTWGF